jgi:hypothetical protein
MSQSSKKITGTKRQLSAKIRASRRKPEAVQRQIAASLGMSLQTLRRKARLLKQGRSIDRKGRSDRGGSRTLPQHWLQLADTMFFTSTAASYAELWRELSERCRRKGLKIPSYSWLKRAINNRFRAIMAAGRIRRIGDFVRIDRKK